MIVPTGEGLRLRLYRRTRTGSTAGPYHGTNETAVQEGLSRYRHDRHRGSRNPFAAAGPDVHGGFMSDRLSPGSGGPLVDPDGGLWTMTRRRLDLRVVRRALRSVDRVVLLGENGGFDLCWVGPEHRSALWARLQDRYVGPSGAVDGDYSGYEFVNNDGDRLMYIEMWC